MQVNRKLVQAEDSRGQKGGSKNRSRGVNISVKGMY